MNIKKRIFHLIRNIYSLIPFKYQILSFVRNNMSLSSKLTRYLFFKGEFMVNVDKEHSFKLMHYGYGFTVENDIFWHGINQGWEKISISLWLKLCVKKRYVLDIGANTGIYSLIAKSLNTNSIVYAFEPVNRVFQKLEENIKLNKYDINAFSYAASNYNGKGVIYDVSSEHVYSVTVNKNLSTRYNTHEVEIQTIKIDSFIEKYKIQKIDLVKIDVETHEPEVLEGFKDYLRFNQPTILVEVLNDEVGERIETILNELNCTYLYFNIDENNGVVKVNEIRRSLFYNYLLCSEHEAKELGLL
jgi:FkbM family methyltransferase